MKLAIRTVCFHFLCILIFGIIYYNIQYQFEYNGKKERKTLLDYILLSTTIQAGVGFSHIYPDTNIAKVIMILQQIMMIMTHVFTLYFFNL
jgi:heme A synthase